MRRVERLLLAVVAAALSAALVSADTITVLRDGTTVTRHDPMTIPTVSGNSVATVAFDAGCSGRYNQIIPLAARVPGVGTSLWQFRLGLYASAATSVDIALLVKDQANPNPTVVNVQVPAGEEVLLDNVLGTLFSTNNAGLGLRYCSGFPLAEGYFYNVGGEPDFVYGAAVPALGPENATTPIRPAYFNRIEYTASAVKGQRVNIGATSNSNFNVPIAVDIYDGTSLLGTINYTLKPYEHHQFTNVHSIIHVSSVPSGHIVVRTLVDEAEIYTYALQVQNKSGDLVYQRPSLAPPLYSTLAGIFNGAWHGTWNNLTFLSSGSVAMTVNIDPNAAAPNPPTGLVATLADPAGAFMPVRALQTDVSALAANPGPSIATLALDLGGNVFGSPDPPSRTLNGYWSTSGVRFLGDVATYGHYDIFILFNGTMFGSLTNIPSANLASLTMTGKVDQGRLDLTQTINFDNKSTATTTWSVTKDAPIF